MAARDKSPVSSKVGETKLDGQLVLNAIPTAAAILNEDGNLVACNRAWTESSHRTGLNAVIFGQPGSHYQAHLIEKKLTGLLEGLINLTSRISSSWTDNVVLGSKDHVRGNVSFTRLKETEQILITVLPMVQPAPEPIEEFERYSKIAEHLLDKTESNVIRVSSLILSAIASEFPNTVCGLFLTTRDSKELRFAGSIGSEALPWTYRPRLDPSGVTMQAAERGEIQEELRTLSKSESENPTGLVTELAVPLMIGDSSLGVLHFQRSGTARFQAAELRLLRFTSERVALALERTRLVEEAKRRNREIEAVVEISSLLRGTNRRQDMAQLILAQITHFLKADGAALAIMAGTSSEPLYIEQSSGDLKGVSGLTGQLSSKVTQPLASTQMPNWDVDAVPALDVSGDLPDLKALAAVPLISDGQAVGTLWAGRSTPFEKDEIHMLTAIGDITANAFRGIELLKQSRRRARQAGLLNQIALAALHADDFQGLLTDLVNHLQSIVGSDQAFLALWDEQNQWVRPGAASAPLDEVYRQLKPEKGEATLTESVVRSGQSQIVHDAAESNFRSNRLAEILPAHSLLAIPLIAKNKRLGAAIVAYTDLHTFSEDEIEQCEHAANQIAMALENADLIDHLGRSNSQLSASYDATIAGWAQALELRDAETKGHSQRVTQLTARLGRAMGLEGLALENLRRGALLHDVGKMGIPDEILLKQDPLTEAERQIMSRHPEYAYDMLADISYLRPALDVPLYHHERWDGGGYPKRLKGEEIPLAARLFAIVDVWDALVSDRPYKRAWSRAEAINYIEKQAGKHFDPKITAIFLELIEQDHQESST
jgi:HD-GYP domain-containing protein (c-di-GMP phosphodiesterase class II)